VAGALARPAVEVEGAIRAWLRTTAPFGNRWYFGPPLTPTFPLGLLTVTSVVPAPGYVPLDQATVTLDMYAAVARDRYTLAGLATQLRTAVDSMPAGTPMGAAVGMGGKVVSGPSHLDPADGKARYVMTAEFTLRP